jgi:negative regulator of flagellin synthesis FlgM
MRIDAFNSVSQVYKAESTYKTPSASKTYTSDKFEISQTGKDMQTAKAAVEAAPDVREDLVADIKERIANGTYQVSSMDFANKMVENYAPELVF